jgi:hypothetical protein
VQSLVYVVEGVQMINTDCVKVENQVFNEVQNQVWWKVHAQVFRKLRGKEWLAELWQQKTYVVTYQNQVLLKVKLQVWYD